MTLAETMAAGLVIYGTACVLVLTLREWIPVNRKETEMEFVIVYNDGEETTIERARDGAVLMSIPSYATETDPSLVGRMLAANSWIETD